MAYLNATGSGKRYQFKMVPKEVLLLTNANIHHHGEENPVALSILKKDGECELRRTSLLVQERPKVLNQNLLLSQRWLAVIQR
jgi:hypothetical protein